MTDLTRLCCRGAEEAAAALSKPRFPGAKSAEVGELPSRPTTARHLCGGGHTGQTWKTLQPFALKKQLCKALQGAHLWGHSPRVLTLVGFVAWKRVPEQRLCGLEMLWCGREEGVAARMPLTLQIVSS